MPGLSFPRVPGHEVAGRIEEVGARVSQWRVDRESASAFSVVKTVTVSLVTVEIYKGDWPRIP